MACGRCRGLTPGPSPQERGGRGGGVEDRGGGCKTGCGERFYVTEEDVVWGKDVYNLFGIKKGDTLECALGKVARWFEGWRKEVEREMAELRR